MNANVRSFRLARTKTNRWVLVFGGIVLISCAVWFVVDQKMLIQSTDDDSGTEQGETINSEALIELVTDEAEPQSTPISSPVSAPVDEPIPVADPGAAVPVDPVTTEWSTYTDTKSGWSIEYPKDWYVYPDTMRFTTISNKPWVEFEPGGCFAEGKCEARAYGTDMDWFYFGIMGEPATEQWEGYECQSLAECHIKRCEQEEQCKYPNPGGFDIKYDWVDKTPLECCSYANYRATLGGNEWILSLPPDYGPDSFELLVNGRLYDVNFVPRYVTDEETGYPAVPVDEPEEFLPLFKQMMATFRVLDP